MNRARVVYWNSQPSPYVVSRFNAVADRGSIDLRVWFEKERDSDRSWDVDESAWRFQARYLPKVQIGSHSTWLPYRELRATKPDVLIMVPDRINAALTLPGARLYSKRIAFRSLPVFDTWIPPTRIRELAKHAMYRVIDGAKVPGPDGSRMAEHYGLPQTRSWRVTQSVDVSHFGTALSLDPTVRLAQRSSLGLRGCVFIYVGRLWEGKGVHHLIEAFAILASRGIDASLLLVGDGQDEASLRTQASHLRDVHFAGFVQPKELPAWYGLADVMVFPTLGDPNGVVVEEAMAAGLPVISTSSAGDICLRVQQGQTGFVVPPADPESMADRMASIAIDQAMRQTMSAAASNSAQAYSDSAYAEDFERFILEVLATPSRMAFPVRRLKDLRSTLDTPIASPQRQ